MGNCIRHESPMQWAGDDWGSPEGDSFFSSESSPLQNKDCAVRTEKKIHSPSSSTAATEVKIKITKKQLQELLSRVDLKELSVQQVLAQLVNVGDDSHRRSWRPALQSIPEVIETGRISLLD